MCVCVFVLGQAVQFVLVIAPRQREREREGCEDGWQAVQWDVISSPLGGIQDFEGLMRSRGN